MSDSAYLGAKLLDKLTSGFFSWLDKKVQNSASYQKIQSKLNKYNLATEIQNLLEKAVNIAKADLPEELDKKILRENIGHNKELIFSWIFEADDLVCSAEIEKLDILYFDSEKTIKIFFKKLFSQIQSNRDNYNLSVLKQIKNSLKTLTDGQKVINSKLDQHTVILHELIELTKKEWNFAAVLDHIEEHFNNRNADAALTVAKSVEEEIESNGGAEEKEKLYQLMVNSYLLKSSEQEDSIPFLEKLISYTSDESKKLQRIILRLVVMHEYDKAQKKIDEIELHNIFDVNVLKKIIGLQINIYFNQHLYDTALEFLSKYKETYADYLFWMFNILIAKESYVEVEKLYYENIDYFETDNFNILKLKFDLLISLNAYKLQNNIYLLNTINSFKSLIDLAEILINRCVDDLILKGTLFSQVGYIYNIVGDKVKSQEAYLKSEQLDATNPILLRNFPINLFYSSERSELEKGMQYLKIYIDNNTEDYYAVSFYYDFAIKLKKKNVEKEIEASYNDVKTPLFVKIKYVELLHVLYQAEKANEILNELAQNYPENPFLYFAYGNHYIKVKDKENALTNYEKCIESGLVPPFRIDAISSVVNIYLNERTPCFDQKVLDLLEHEYDEIFLLYNFKDQYIESLFRLKKYSKCVSFCEKVEELGLKTAHIIRTKCLCYFTTQNYLLATKSYEELFNIEEDHNFDLFNYASCLISIGDIVKAKNLINYLPPPDSVSDFIYKCRFMIFIEDCDSAIDTIIEGYSRHKKSQEIMELFITLVFQYRTKPLSRAANKLFNECVNAYDKSKFQNKILKKFSFPEELDAEGIINTMKKVVESFDVKSIESPQVKYLEFQKKKLPTSFITSLENKKILYIWYETLLNRGMAFWSSSGNKSDDSELEFITNEIYIDLSSLLILYELSLLNELKNCFDTIYIAQSILSELQNVLLDKQSNILPINYLDLIEVQNGLYKQYDNQFYNRVWSASEDILKFLKNNKATFVITGQPLNPINNAPEQLSFFKNFNTIIFDVDCLIYSYESSKPIFYDNITFRDVFNNLEKSPGAFGLSAFLKKVAIDNKWKTSRYNRILLDLINYNYYYFEINSTLFIHCILDEGYQLNDRTYKIFSLLNNQSYKKDDIIKIFIKLLMWLWFHPMVLEIKSKWTYFLIDTLTIRNDISYYEISQILKRLKDNMINKYCKDYLSDIISNLDSFRNLN